MKKLLILAIVTITVACENNYPTDPENTLQQVHNNILRVGIADSPDRSLYNNGNPSGIEVDLVKGYAQSIDAEIKWTHGSQEQIANLLKEYQLDIGIGGFSKTTPLKKHVGLTHAYDTQIIKIAAPKGTAIPEKIKGEKVVVKKGSSALVAVGMKKGIPIVVDSITEITSLTAAPEQELMKKNVVISEYNLHKIQHVLAVPKGENALLKSLENYIYSEWKNQKIKTSL